MTKLSDNLDEKNIIKNSLYIILRGNLDNVKFLYFSGKETWKISVLLASFSMVIPISWLFWSLLFLHYYRYILLVF